MAESKPGRNAALYAELAHVNGAVVGRAQNHESVRVMVAAVGAQVHVVNVHEYSVLAAGHDAASAVTAHHFAPHCWWDVLRRAGPLRSL